MFQNKMPATKSKRKRNKEVRITILSKRKCQMINSQLNNSLNPNKKIMKQNLTQMGKLSRKVQKVRNNCQRKKNGDLRRQQKKLLWRIRVHYLLRKRKTPTNQTTVKAAKSKNSNQKAIQVFVAGFVNLNSKVETNLWNIWRRVDTPLRLHTWNEFNFT